MKRSYLFSLQNLQVQVGEIHQVQDRHAETLQDVVGEFGGQFPHAFQHVMHLRLRDLQNPGKSALGEITVGNSVIYKPYESHLEDTKSDGLAA